MDYMEILLPLGDTLGIIWRLLHRYEIPGVSREIVAPLGDTWRLYGDCSTTRTYPGDYMEICSTTR